jgi:hypothetical protein
MAKSSDSMMAGGAGMSPRKAMGMGKGDSGAGSVGSLETVQRPKAIMGVKGGKELADHERGIGGSVSRGKGMHPGQAQPDHGSTHPMGTGTEHYAGKV